MRKILYALCAVGFAAMFAACNNGNYDVTPGVDNSGSNPLNPSGGSGTASVGQIVAKINGTQYTFAGNFMTVGGGRTIAGAYLGSDNVVHSIGLTMFNYTGAGTYTIADGNTTVGANYATSQTNGSQGNGQVTAYSTGSTYNPTGNHGTITVATDASNVMTGTFSFVAYNAGTDTSKHDFITVTNGSFNVQGQ